MHHLVQAAVDRIRQDAVGAATLAEWIGEGAIPVSESLANKRADVCATCPQNVYKVKKVEKAIAEAILKGEEIRNKIDLRTSNDHNLRTCVTCGCYLKLKVWVPLKNIRESEFPKHCWFWNESQPGFSEEEPKKFDPQPEPLGGVQITVDRQSGMGDAIMASSIASFLNSKGYKVGLWTAPGLRTMFRGHKDFECLEQPSGMHVSLNGAFERDPSRANLDRISVYFDKAKNELSRYGIFFTETDLPEPTLTATEDEISDASIEMMAMKRPFIAISPGSDHYSNRDIPVEIWGEACRKMPGTPVWVGNRNAPPGVFDPKIRTLRRLMAFIAISDACVSADTGPMHVAIAMKKPTLAIEGPFLAVKMLPKTSKWKSINAGIKCIGCGEFFCPLDEKDKDSCTRLNPDKIAQSVTSMIYGE